MKIKPIQKVQTTDISFKPPTSKEDYNADPLEIKPIHISFKDDIGEAKEGEVEYDVPKQDSVYPKPDSKVEDEEEEEEYEEEEEEQEEGKPILMGEYSDFIGVYKKAVPQDFCAEIRKALDYYMGIGACRINDDQFPESMAGRFDYAIDLSHMSPKLDGRADRDLNEYIFRCFEEYKHVFGHIKPLRFYSTNQKVQMTPTGGGYHTWHDENTEDPGADAARKLVWMVYLNDGYDGGETEFLYYKRRIKPEMGTLLIFPAGMTHAHRGNMVLDGSKYVVTGWFIRSPGAQ